MTLNMEVIEPVGEVAEPVEEKREPHEQVAEPHKYSLRTPKEVDYNPPIQRRRLPGAQVKSAESMSPNSAYCPGTPSKTSDPLVQRVDLSADSMDPPSRGVDPPSGSMDPLSRRVDPPLGRVDPFPRRVDPSSGRVDPSSRGVDPTFQRAEETSDNVLPSEMGLVCLYGASWLCPLLALVSSSLSSQEPR